MSNFRKFSAFFKLAALSFVLMSSPVNAQVKEGFTTNCDSSCKNYTFDDIKVLGESIVTSQGKSQVVAIGHIDNLDLPSGRLGAIEVEFGVGAKKRSNGGVWLDPTNWMFLVFEPTEFNDEEWQKLRLELMRAYKTGTMFAVEGKFGVFYNTHKLYFHGKKLHDLSNPLKDGK